MRNPILEKRIIPVTHPTDNQKSVLSKIVAAATPRLAAADVSENPNLSAARDMLEKMGLIELTDEGAFVTDAGTEVMVNQNLSTPDGGLTDDGMEAAHGKEAAAQAAPQEPGFDFGMGGEEEPLPGGEDELGGDLGDELGGEKEGDVELELDIGEKFSLLNDLRDRVILENLSNVPHDLVKQLTPIERRQLERILDGQEELYKYKEIYAKLYNYFEKDMPYGVAKARTGDPDQWIVDRLNTRDPGDAIDHAEYVMDPDR